MCNMGLYEVCIALQCTKDYLCYNIMNWQHYSRVCHYWYVCSESCVLRAVGIHYVLSLATNATV